MNQATTAGRAPATSAMRVFERFLAVWVLLCIAPALPGPVRAQVNLSVGLLIWAMVVPMLRKVDFGTLGQAGRHWRGIGVTLFVNWAVKPFSMALLAWLFIRQVFAQMAAHRPARQLCHRPDPAGCRALYGHGLL